MGSSLYFRSIFWQGELVEHVESKTMLRIFRFTTKAQDKVICMDINATKLRNGCHDRTLMHVYDVAQIKKLTVKEKEMVKVLYGV